MNSNQENPHESQDIMILAYENLGSLLYGYIKFFKPGSKPEQSDPILQSAPFVIRQTIGPNETVVYGSIDHLVREIQQLNKDLYKHVDELNATFYSADEMPDTKATSKPIPPGDQAKKTYIQYSRHMTNMLIVLAVQTRNLLDLFSRMGKMEEPMISLRDYDGKFMEKIELRNLLNQFVHNQYLYFDGEYVSDLFSSEPSSKAPIIKLFMGYKINWVEYADLIESTIREIKFRNFTKFLRGQLEELTGNSSHSHIVFAVQNLESLSMLLATKISDGRYKTMLELLFDETSDRYYNDNKDKCVHNTVKVGIEFTEPHIKRHEQLGKKSFEVFVKLRCRLLDNEEGVVCEERELSQRRIEVSYEKFLDCVDKVFGKDPLLN